QAALELLDLHRHLRHLLVLARPRLPVALLELLPEVEDGAPRLVVAEQAGARRRPAGQRSDGDARGRDESRTPRSAHAQRVASSAARLDRRLVVELHARAGRQRGDGDRSDEMPMEGLHVLSFACLLTPPRWRATSARRGPTPARADRPSGTAGEP